MNRIILIGNGFDLAHGLETSYKQFIDNLWQEKIKNIIKSSQLPNHNGKRIYSDDDIKIESIHRNLDNINNYMHLKEYFKDISIKNKFLGKITENTLLKNWVDIEIEYYDSLKQIIIPKYESKSDPGNEFKYDDIKVLNNDFDKIKSYLVSYIQSIIDENNINSFDSIKKQIYSYIKYRDCIENTLNGKAEQEFVNFASGKIERLKLWMGDTKEKLVKYLRADPDGEVLKELPENILFLNFNYTTLEEKYYVEIKDRSRLELVPIKLDSIHIHGSFKEPDNYPIIFGYGDEIEENYQTIENSNENEYLENIKSIKYFETDNYKNLLSFISKGEYQVFLFGHSCGISDRVLLSTLFEHKNCVSIKPFYRKIKKMDKNGNETIRDNYSDIIRNISRHFKDKAVMRDKIVPKIYCEPLLD